MFESEGLGTQALLYANGEMEPDAAADFERRLGEDQTAREALAQAVALSRTLIQVSAVRPTSDYRAEARRRLLPPQSRTQRGHPVLWMLAGAALAILMLLPWWLYLASERSLNAGAMLPPSKVDAHGEQTSASNHQDGRGWAEMNGKDCMAKACCEAMHHKFSFEKHRLTHSQVRPNHFTGPPLLMRQ
jgi:anti-sigma factor RsiW